MSGARVIVLRTPRRHVVSALELKCMSIFMVGQVGASMAAARSANLNNRLAGNNSLPARQNDASAGVAPLHLAVPYHPAASAKLVAQAAETADTEVSKGPANGSGVRAAAEGAHPETPGARVAEGALEEPAAAPGPAAPALQDHQADQVAPTPPSSSPGLFGLSSVQQERVASVTVEGAHPEASGARVAEGALEKPAAAAGPALQDHAEPTRSPSSSSDRSGLSSVQQERVASVTAVVRCDDATAAIQLLAHSRLASLHTTQLHYQEHDIEAGADQDTPAPEAHPQQLPPPQVDDSTKKLQLPPQQQQNKRALEESAVVEARWQPPQDPRDNIKQAERQDSPRKRQPRKPMPVPAVAGPGPEVQSQPAHAGGGPPTATVTPGAAAAAQRPQPAALSLSPLDQTQVRAMISSVAEFTGCGEEAALMLLKQSHWVVDTAVGRYLDRRPKAGDGIKKFAPSDVPAQLWNTAAHEGSTYTEPEPASRSDLSGTEQTAPTDAVNSFIANDGAAQKVQVSEHHQFRQEEVATGRGDGGAGIKCLICLAEPAVGTEVCLLRCGHQYCRYCIEQWWRIAANNTCPTCRKHHTSFRGTTFSTISALPASVPPAVTTLLRPKKRIRKLTAPEKLPPVNETPGKNASAPADNAIDRGEPFNGVGTKITSLYRKYVCKEDDTIASVVHSIEQSTMDPASMKEHMLAINQKLLFGSTLLAKSRLRTGTILLVPDAACELCTIVTKYLGFFDAEDRNSEMWEATDGDGQIYRVDAPTVYEGMGYSTDPDGAYVGESVLRRFEHDDEDGDVESDGMVVARMAAEGEKEQLVGLVRENGPGSWDDKALQLGTGEPPTFVASFASFASVVPVSPISPCVSGR